MCRRGRVRPSVAVKASEGHQGFRAAVPQGATALAYLPCPGAVPPAAARLAYRSPVAASRACPRFPNATVTARGFPWSSDAGTGSPGGPWSPEGNPLRPGAGRGSPGGRWSAGVGLRRLGAGVRVQTGLWGAGGSVPAYPSRLGVGSVRGGGWFRGVGSALLPCGRLRRPCGAGGWALGPGWGRGGEGPTPGSEGCRLVEGSAGMRAAGRLRPLVRGGVGRRRPAGTGGCRLGTGARRLRVNGRRWWTGGRPRGQPRSPGGRRGFGRMGLGGGARRGRRWRPRRVRGSGSGGPTCVPR